MSTKLNVLETAYANWLNVRETGRVTHSDLTALKAAIDLGIAPPAVMEGMDPFKRKGTDAVPGTWPHYADAAAQANDEGDEFAMPVLSERKKRAQRIISLLGNKKADLDDAQRGWLDAAEKTFGFCNKRIKFFDEFLCVKILSAIDAAGKKEADRIREEERRSQEAARRSREEERRARDAADPAGAKAREELRASAAKSPVLPPVLARPVGGLPRPVAQAAAPKKAEPAPKPAPAPMKEAAPKQTSHVETTIGQDMLKTFEENVASNKEQGLGETEARLAASEDILNRILTGDYNEIARKLLKNELLRAVTATMKPLSTGDKDAAAQARLWMSQTEDKLRAAPRKRSQKKRDAREDRPVERRTEADVAARPVEPEEDVVAEMLSRTLVPKAPTTTEAPISATAQAPTA